MYIKKSEWTKVKQDIAKCKKELRLLKIKYHELLKKEVLQQPVQLMEEEESNDEIDDFVNRFINHL